MAPPAVLVVLSVLLIACVKGTLGYTESALSKAVRAEIQSLPTKLRRASDYTTMLGYLNYGLGLAKNVDLSPLANSTILLPRNSAVNAMGRARNNMKKVEAVLPYHAVTGKYSFRTLFKTKIHVLHSPIIKPYVSKSLPIYKYKSGSTRAGNANIAFSGVNKATTKQQCNIVSANLYIGTYLNLQGIDKVLLPPGITL